MDRGHGCRGRGLGGMGGDVGRGDIEADVWEVLVGGGIGRRGYNVCRGMGIYETRF